MKPHQFEPRIDVLPKAQGRLWPELEATPSYFTLYDGTALALRLAHRQSVDFDFFTGKSFVGAKILEEIPYLRSAKVRQLEPNALTCSVHRTGSIRLSFFGGLSPGQALRDLAGTKLSVVTQRAEAKDYVDIHALLTEARLPLDEMLGCARAIFGPGFDPLHSLKALAYHDDPALVALNSGIKRDLLAAIRTVDAARVPAIKPLRRPKAKR